MENLSKLESDLWEAAETIRWRIGGYVVAKRSAHTAETAVTVRNGVE